MLTLSINQLTTFRWSFDEDTYFARRAGFRSIGVWRRKLEDFGQERARELLEESGLTVSCLSWAGGFTGGDGRSLDESVRDGLAAVEAAANIDAGCLVVFAGGRNNHIERQANRLLRQGIDELLIAAELADVTLALKTLRAECATEWTFQTNLTAALDLVAEYNSPHLKLVYDHYQFPEVATQPAFLKDLIPHLALVQLADARLPHSIELERCPLGRGVLPVGETVAALLAAGYNGPLDVELMGSEIEVCDYGQLVEETFRTLSTYVASADQKKAKLAVASAHGG